MNQILLLANAIQHVSFVDALVTSLALRFSLVDVTMWAIQFLSTIFERFLLLLSCAIAIAITMFVTRRLHSGAARLYVPPVAIFVIFRLLYLAFPSEHGADVAVSLVILMVLIDLPSWRRGSDSTAPIGATRWVLAITLVPFIGVLFLNGWSLQNLAHRLHRDRSVENFASLDADDLALDSVNGLLYVSGHGTDQILAYDVNDLAKPPRRSQARTGRAQSFCYDRAHQELYVYNQSVATLLFLRAKTLETVKTVPDLTITAGDVRIAVDGLTDSLLIASEGAYWGAPTDEQGYPFAVVNRTSGQLVYTTRNCNGLCIPALTYMHPTKPLLYMGFAKEMRLFNTVTRTTIGPAPAINEWVDGIAVTSDGTEALVGAPLRSTVLRLDDESLELKGTIGTVFGVRTLSVDSERDLLLTASLATNALDVIDLKTSRRLATYYLGPWLRAIALDPRNGIAYVSSVRGLFKVTYTSRLRGMNPALPSGQR